MKRHTLAVAALALIGASAQAATITGPTVLYMGHDYSLLSADSWAASEAYAVSQGGHLVSIDDDAENTFILSTFRPTGSIWIGLKRVGLGASVQAKSATDAPRPTRSRPIQIEPVGRKVLRINEFSAASSIDTRCPPWLTA